MSMIPIPITPSVATASPPAPPLPLERLRLPDELDGRASGNRAGPDVVCQLAAGNDLEAVQAWLAKFHDSPQTPRIWLYNKPITSYR